MAIDAVRNVTLMFASTPKNRASLARRSSATGSFSQAEPIGRRGPFCPLVPKDTKLTQSYQSRLRPAVRSNTWLTIRQGGRGSRFLDREE